MAPSPSIIRDPKDLAEDLVRMLSEDFALDRCGVFNVFVEGTTDRDYLLRAAELQESENGSDLLSVPSHLVDEEIPSIIIQAPGRPGSPHRGGTPQMVRLARALQPFVFTLGAFRGVLFLFDHDQDGTESATKIREYGYQPGHHSLTLDPSEHPAACGDRGVVIEDLLSLSIQEQFFEGGGASCSAEYVEGRLTRFHWAHASKAALRDFVLANGGYEDFKEVVTVLRRVRRAFGLPSS